MNHLSTAELLLLAEGELDEVRAAHAAGCAECQAASEQAMGDLGAVAGALAVTLPSDSNDLRAESWVRFRAALAASAPRHVDIEDLLLHLDGETAAAVDEHLATCTDCHDELLRAQTLLVDVEHELRALIPEETKQQRLASARRLEKALDARRKRVLTFPAPWRAVYAAAALLAAGLFGFSWYAQQPAQMTLSMAAPTAPAAPAISLTVESTRTAPALDVEAPATIAVAQIAPERFAELAVAASTAPRATALNEAPAPLVAFSTQPVALQRLELPRVAQPIEERDEPFFASEPTRIVVNERPVGGMVRTALLEHYEDATRRSFRSARPELLEGELARYVSEIFYADSELLRHAYSLHQMLESANVESLDAESRKRLRADARKSLATIRSQEERLYTKLSEALPRRYWATKGARDSASAEMNLEAQSGALLDAALQLDKSLSSVLVSADSSVSADTASLGDLLYVVRSSSRNLQERLSVLR